MTSEDFRHEFFDYPKLYKTLNYHLISSKVLWLFWAKSMNTEKYSHLGHLIEQELRGS